MTPLMKTALFGIAGLFSLFNAARILRTGIVKGRYGARTSANDAPVFFWLNVCALLILGFGFLVMAAINFF